MTMPDQIMRLFLTFQHLGPTLEMGLSVLVPALVVGIAVLAYACGRRTREATAQSLAQTNALLAQASDRFQELFQGLPVACFCYDRDGRIMEWNRSFQRLYGLDNVIGNSIWETVYCREEAPEIADAVAAVLDGTAQEGIEWTHWRADGSQARLYSRIFPLRGVAGEITGGISADVDITAQHEAEEDLRVSEERLHALYNTTSQQSLSFEDKTQALLTTGCEQFGLTVGVLAQAVPDPAQEEYRIVQAQSPAAVLAPGVAFSGHLEAGIRAPIRVSGKVWGTLCFGGSQTQARLYTSGDREMVRLMAQWLGSEVARRQAEEALRDSEERFRSAIASMSEALIVLDAEGLIRLCNDSAERILGLTQSEIKEWRPLNPDYIARREDGSPFPQGSYPLFVSLRGGRPQRDVVMGLPRPNGSLLWVSVNSNPLFLPDCDTPYAIVATFSDITERRRCEAQITAQMAQIREHASALEVQKTELETANAQLEALAMHDGLTGLGNRRAFEKRLTHEIERAARYGHPLSLLMLDVDQFKEYNDSFGHQAGDEVLKTLAVVLQAQGRETDFFARYGGEEFVVLLPHTDKSGALKVAERLRIALQAILWPERAVTASFGVSTLVPAIQDEAGLVSAADAALYAAKIAGRNQVIHVHSLPGIIGAANMR